MPVVERRNPRVTASLATTCDILSDEDAYLTSVAARSLRDLTRREGEGLLVLDAGRLAALEVAIARRVVRAALLSISPDARLEARHIAGILRIVAAGEGSLTVPLAVSARVEHGLLLMRTRTDAPVPSAAWLEVPGRLELSGDHARTLTARVLPVPAGTSAPEMARSHALEWAGESVLLDARAAGVDPIHGGQLWVDAPHPGDVLCPLGMHGQSKKVSDLLGEARVPLDERGNVPVVRSSPTGPTLWVAPIRADERARCTSATKWLLELTLIRS